MAWAKEKAEETRKPRKSLKDEMKERLFSKPVVLSESVPTTLMILGEDGVGKSALSLAILTEKDIEEGKKIVVIDMDSGMLPLILSHHREAITKGHIIYFDPIVWGEDAEGEPTLDYDTTIDNVRAAALAAKEENDENQNIKAVILDGASKLLRFGEAQMRLEKELGPDSGVSQRFWMIRNRLFAETLELLKGLSFHTIFTFHSDFDLKVQGDQKISAAKLNAHQMSFQKVLCEKNDKGNVVEFRATILKDKFHLTKEGKVIKFATVNKEDESFVWEPNKVIEELLVEGEKGG